MTDQPILLSPGRLFAELVVVTNRLGELMAEEIALLRVPGLPRLDHIVPEKLKLAARYDALMRLMRQQPGIERSACLEAPGLAPSVKRLGELARANAKAVDIHLKATRRVLELVARAARRATTANFTYGKERLGYGARSERHPSITVNRVL
jgi:hypothetical protein